jgi:hypothetical protein
VIKMKRKHLYYSLLIAVILAGAIVWAFLEKEKLPPITTSGEEWGVTMNLLASENGDGACGIITITLPENSGISPIDKLRDILGGMIGKGCQYWPDHHLIENLREKNVMHYLYEFGAVPSNFLGPSIPPIRQDNENVNFCFYVAHGAEPLSTSTWWSEIGCNYLRFKLILPENYDLRMDVRNPSGIGGKGWFKDNDYSIFTTASSLTKMLENNRWCIEAIWEPRNPSPIITADLYLEVHYRKA